MVEARKVANKIESEREKGHCLPRHHRPDAGRDPLSHRQVGTDCRQPDVDAAKIQGTLVYKISAERSALTE